VFTGSRVIAVLAGAAIAASVALMAFVSAAGPSVSVPILDAVHHVSPGSHLSATFVIVSLWIALGLGCAGVLAGLAAVARGARPPLWLLLGFALIAVCVLTVLPPAGSTDTISYAVSGRMVVLGHNPYLMTPLQLRHAGDVVARQVPFAQIPASWNTTASVYGPVATGFEWLAAVLGGTSLGHIVVWLKVLEALAFGVVALVLDRLLRSDPVMRLRAHLLWTVNPVLLWEIIAGGHIDGLAAAFGLLGVVLLRPRYGVQGAFLAGLLTGVATGVKVEYALLGLAVAWACRRSVLSLAATALGFAAAVLPAYLLAGSAAIKVLVTRGPGITWDTMYQLFWRPVLGYHKFDVSDIPPHLELVAYLLFAAVVLLVLWRFPDRAPGWPAVSPALGLSLAWLFMTAFQRPWYDVMAVSLLALYGTPSRPASWLDRVVLIRLLAGATVYVIAVNNPVQPRWLYNLGQYNGMWLAPSIRLLAAIALVTLCILAGGRSSRSRYPQDGAVDSEAGNAAGPKLPLAT
jgi:hypothetical protein